MDKFLVRSQAKLLELLLHIILHRLHIVIGCLFNLLYLLSIRQLETGIDRPQGLQLRFSQMG
jgi:hypothetical protein